jgi:hypothetical protein
LNFGLNFDKIGSGERRVKGMENYEKGSNARGKDFQPADQVPD